MRKWLLMLAMCAASVGKAQFQSQQYETKLVDLHYVDFRRVTQGGVLDPFQVRVSGSGQTVVLGGPPSNIAAAEAFIRKLDVKPRNVEAIFYVLAASTAAGGGGTLPADLEPVVKQLRNAFAYQSFKLLETAVARTREGAEMGANGHLPVQDPDTSMKRTYNLRSQRVSVSPGEKGNIIRFDNLQFFVHSPDIIKANISKKPEFNTSGVNADIDVREGQKVVVGKANFDGADGNFFLIVTAKVVD